MKCWARVFIAVVLGTFVVQARAFAETPTLDKYGGYTDLPVAGGATGYFRLAKTENRWLFVSPEGNAFWLRSVYAVDHGAGGNAYVEALKRKYDFPQWMPWDQFTIRAVQRLREWGFNALGEYTSIRVLPIRVYGAKTGNPEKMPFIRIVRPALYSTKRNAIAEPVKDLIFGTDATIYRGWRAAGFPDVFDSNFVKFTQVAVRDERIYNTPDKLNESPWLIGTTMDDKDYLFGFGPSPELRPESYHPHLGWLVAATAPSQDRNSSNGIEYSDRTVYSKLAFRDFLRRRYTTLDALNVAWGATYTTWESDGGWPNGRGVLDESGRGRWMGRDYDRLKDTGPRVKADLDDWLGEIAERYVSVVATAVRASTPRHLVFGPAVPASARPQILQAIGRHVDAVQTTEYPMRFDLNLRAYAITAKPIFTWTSFQAHADSPFAGGRGAWPTGGWNLPTQEQRGQAYATLLQRSLMLRAPDQTYFMIGTNWWEWSDHVREQANFGLVTIRDNAYDGKEAVRATGRDRAGQPTGGEDRDYGDFISAVRRANLSVFDVLRNALKK